MLLFLLEVNNKYRRFFLCFFAFLSCISVTYGHISVSNADTLRNLRKLNVKLNVVIYNVIDENRKPAADSLTILKEVENLNIGFNPIGVYFDICNYKSINKLDEDVPDSVFNNIRFLFNRYKISNSVNLFFVHELTDKKHKCSFNLGNIGTDNVSGVFFTCLNRGDILHEVGHIFGLADTFGNGKELADGSNCKTEGDLICDTPADPFKEGTDTTDYVSPSCNFHFKGKDARNGYYFPVVSNPMGPYSLCRCPAFSKEQYKKMSSVIKKPKVW